MKYIRNNASERCKLHDAQKKKRKKTLSFSCVVYHFIMVIIIIRSLGFGKKRRRAKSGLEKRVCGLTCPAPQVELVEPRFNRMTVFDPRLPHGVPVVEGTHDPREGRLVLHGWFNEPSPFFSGGVRSLPRVGFNLA